MSKQLLISIVASLTILLTPAMAFAHVIVTPKQAGIGEELTFNVNVPNEKQTPVINIKLLIPNGVTNVIPTSISGWTITTTLGKNSSDVTAINWLNGTIPVGQRTDFTFSAQVPANPGEVDWKAYQTYADGTVVHWDQKPAGSDDSTGNAGPYSVTQVINDLTGTSATANGAKNNLAGPYMVAGIALVVALAALVVKRK